MRRRRRDDGGFTLLELLVVTMIIGILVGIVFPVYRRQREKAYKAEAVQDMRYAALAIESWVAGDPQRTYAALNLQDEDSTVLVESEGYRHGDWTRLIIHSNHREYCIKGEHRMVAGAEFVYRSNAGVVEVGRRGATPCNPYE